MSRGPTCSASWSTSPHLSGHSRHDWIAIGSNITACRCYTTRWPQGNGKEKDTQVRETDRQSIRFWECLWVQRQRWAPKMGSNGRCIVQYDCHPTLHPSRSTILLCHPAPGSPSQWKREGFICEAATSVTGRWLVGWLRTMSEDGGNIRCNCYQLGS